MCLCDHVVSHLSTWFHVACVCVRFLLLRDKKNIVLWRNNYRPLFSVFSFNDPRLSQGRHWLHRFLFCVSVLTFFFLEKKI